MAADAVKQLNVGQGKIKELLVFQELISKNRALIPELFGILDRMLLHPETGYILSQEVFSNSISLQIRETDLLIAHAFQALID